jgi:GTP-binding protein
MARKRLSAVVLVGRPNVGKSTLFNRISGSRRSIVAPMAGTTRDRLAADATWRGVTFQLIDTGGLFGASEDPLHAQVVRHGWAAVEESDLVVFVVDGREGLVPGDLTIAQALRKTGRSIVLAVNKTDDKRARQATEFHQLGFDPVFEISAEHGDGVGDLLDAVVEGLGRPPQGRGAEPAAQPEPRSVTVAIVGRPNVGKSSLLNRLLSEDRALVSELPGTTRDPVATDVTWHRKRLRIIDTAGMRRPGRVGRGGPIEVASVAAASRAIADADVVALVVDASSGIADQDLAIGGEADRAGRGIAIVLNKWDLVKRPDPSFAKRFDEDVRDRSAFLAYAPVLHVSALTGERVSKILETIDRIATARRLRVPTPALNAFVKEITTANPPVSPGRRHVRVLYAAQAGVAPPTFAFFTNVASTFHFSYERFLTNQLRDRFGFMGTPIRIQVRRRGGGST